ncbi:MAG: winged helix-turn-helix domain-containing protein [Acidobacteria bacterium]|nr:winged helix-turn-helix domain-containing protein [Acidobacteriota bacterium]
MNPLAISRGSVSAATAPAMVGPLAAPQSTRLTRKERELLNILMQNPGRCISRETLLTTVWKYSEGARTRTVDVHVQRLRRKLGRDAAALKTIVRLGYCWFPEPEALGRPAPVW